MRAIRLSMVLVTLSFPMMAQASETEREAIQAELDAACEAARDQKLVPLREKMVDVCLEEQEFESQEECEDYYANYGERAGGRNALFYDLPACVKAFEYAQSERSGG